MLPWAWKFSTAVACRSANSAAISAAVAVVLLRLTLLTSSTRTSAASAPNADVRPGCSGTITRSMPIASAISAAWVGPAPPIAISAWSRGSTPSSTVTMRTALAMFSLAMRTIEEATRDRVAAEPAGQPRAPRGCAARRA